MTRRQVATVGVAGVALLLAWYLLLWSPKSADLDAARARRSSATSQVAQLQLRLDHLKDAQRRAPELRATADRLHSAVPDTADLAEFLLQTNDAATKAGVDFLSVSPAPTAASPAGPSAIQLSLNLKGGYRPTLDFMDRLLDLPRIVVLDSVSVSAGGPAAGAPALDVVVTGRMFTTEAPAPATPAPTTPAATPAATAPTTSAAAPSTNRMVG